MKRSIAWTMLALGLACDTPPPAPKVETFRSGVFDPPRAAPDFELLGSNGAPFTLASLRGKVVILEFGFTTCQAVCPFTLSNLVQVMKALGPDASRVQLVFVTVDPERDSVDRLREYLGKLHPSFLGATGTPEQLAAVREGYGVLAQKVASEDGAVGYQVNHSSSIYLIDREGLLRALVPFGKPPDDIAHDLHLLLQDDP